MSSERLRDPSEHSGKGEAENHKGLWHRKRLNLASGRDYLIGNWSVGRKRISSRPVLNELDKKYGLTNRRRLAVGDLEFSLVDTGYGEPVVLLHGYPQSLLMWRHQIPALGRSFRVVAPDWPG